MQHYITQTGVIYLYLFDRTSSWNYCSLMEYMCLDHHSKSHVKVNYEILYNKQNVTVFRQKAWWLGFQRSCIGWNSNCG